MVRFVTTNDIREINAALLHMEKSLRISQQKEGNTSPGSADLPGSSYTGAPVVDIEVILQQLRDAESDGSLTEQEKLLYRPLWVTAQAERLDLDPRADAVFGQTCTERQAYDAAYDSLALCATDWTNSGTTDISGRVPPIATRWSNYWTQKTLLQNAIVGNMAGKIADIASDNILSRSEKPWIATQYDSLIAEWASNDRAAAKALQILAGDGVVKVANLYSMDGFAPVSPVFTQILNNVTTVLTPAVSGLVATFATAPPVGAVVSMASKNDGISAARTANADAIAALTTYLESLP